MSFEIFDDEIGRAIRIEDGKSWLAASPQEHGFFISFGEEFEPLDNGCVPCIVIPCIELSPDDRRALAKFLTADLDAMPADARPIPGLPDYKIDKNGTAWRFTPSGRKSRPPPFRVAVVMMGSVGNKKSPAVNLGGTVRTIRSLMRQVWPEVQYSPPEQPK